MEISIATHGISISFGMVHPTLSTCMLQTYESSSECSSSGHAPQLAPIPPPFLTTPTTCSTRPHLMTLSRSMLYTSKCNTQRSTRSMRRSPAQWSTSAATTSGPSERISPDSTRASIACGGSKVCMCGGGSSTSGPSERIAPDSTRAPIACGGSKGGAAPLARANASRLTAHAPRSPAEQRLT
eukprot:365859-Chlamydomonas_euryale.AAC.2